MRPVNGKFNRNSTSILLNSGLARHMKASDLRKLDLSSVDPYEAFDALKNSRNVNTVRKVVRNIEIDSNNPDMENLKKWE